MPKTGNSPVGRLRPARPAAATHLPPDPPADTRADGIPPRATKLHGHQRNGYSNIREVAQGKAWLSPDVSSAVIEDYRKHVTEPIDLLSPREREVLQMIAEGRTNKEIAAVLHLSIYTVEAHRGRIMEKLNLHTGTELVRFAIRHGVID